MQDHTQEVALTIIICIGLFFTLALILLSFILTYQKKKFQHKEQLVGMQERYRQELLSSQLEVAEHTRLYIARELHDNIGTLSSIIKMNLDLATAESGSPERRGTILTESKELIRTLITDIKQLSVSLNSDRIADMKLENLLQVEVGRLQKLMLFDIDYSIHTEGEEYELPSDKRIILYRMCQELLHNVLKHASPKHVIVKLDQGPDRVKVTIEDDGNGFDLDSTLQAAPQNTSGSGSGLVNLRNRAKLINGDFFIYSSAGNGVKSYIEVPFTKN